MASNAKSGVKSPVLEEPASGAGDAAERKHRAGVSGLGAVGCIPGAGATARLELAHHPRAEGTAAPVNPPGNKNETFWGKSDTGQGGGKWQSREKTLSIPQALRKTQIYGSSSVGSPVPPPGLCQTGSPLRHHSLGLNSRSPPPSRGLREGKRRKKSYFSS